MVITQTPLRISLVGGGTDLKDFYLKEGGAVLTTAINKYIYVVVYERFNSVFDKRIYVNYSKKEVVRDVNELQHELVRESLKKVGILNSIEITTFADIPTVGTGLGSSSAVTVGLLNALSHTIGIQRSARSLAAAACEIEIDKLNKPIGVQDQYITSYGGFRILKFHQDGQIEVHNVKISRQRKQALDNNLLLFFTGITGKQRNSNDISYNQTKNIGKTLNELRKLKSMVLELQKILAGNYNLDDVGRLLHENWLLKKKFATMVSNPVLEKMYNEARLAGAIGGKVCGAGGGGFMVLYCPLNKQADIRRALAHYKELPFNFSDTGSELIFNWKK